MNNSKQRIKTLFVCILLTVFCSSLIVSEVDTFADNRSYEIYEYTINVAVNTDGSADIEEIIRYDFHGSFNGVYRDIDFSRTDGITNFRIYVINMDGSFNEIIPSSENNESKDGTYTDYIAEYGISPYSETIAKYKVYEKSYNERKTFVYQYRFNNVVTKYDDIAEFNRKIVDSNWDVPLNNITINITLPRGASKEEIKVFGHGSLLGESEIINGQKVVFTVPYVMPGEMVETLVLFPTHLVPEAMQIVSKEALPGILENERTLAEEANEQREVARRELEREQTFNIIGTALVGFLTVLWVALFIYVYNKYDKELESDFKQKYYRELPGNYTPAEMSCLMSMGHINTNDITATLMDLVRKRYLILTTERVVKKRLILQDKQIESYAVSINPNAPSSAYLKRHEEFLIEWFIHRLGDGNTIILDNISDYTKSERNATKFCKDYRSFSDLATKEAEKLNFFDKSSDKGKFIIRIAAIMYFIIAFVILFIFETSWALILLFISIFTFIYSVTINKRTRYGNEQKAKWTAFRNFLKDFSRLDKAGLPSIVIWEHYLVYAISLGVAKEVIKQLPLVISEYDYNDGNLTFLSGYGSSIVFTDFTHVLDSTISSVTNAIDNAMNVANSTLSSSSGSGGGFSGGSSGGGGGGGGGGAF